ncbi:MAG: methyltransferase domain-containing protein, partial [Actinomycetota bacterium]
VLVADALRARARLRRLPVLPVGTADEDAPDAEVTDFSAVTADGVVVPPAVIAAAAGHARAEGLDVVDLVPGDLGPEEALELAAQVDPATYREDRLALGRGPFRALLVRSSVLERSRIDLTEDLDPVAFVEADTELKHLSPVGCDLVIAPGFSAGRLDVDRRAGLLRALFGDATPVVLAVPLAGWTVITLGLALAPPWGALALAAYCAQPVIATAGTRMASPELGRQSALRWWREPVRWWRTLTGRWAPPPEPDPVETRRSAYTEELAAGVERFFETRRTDCPLCGAAELEERLRTRDVIQYKPGEFVLDRCRACGHVFQNPRLSVAGLDFFYRDFYDGLGEQSTELIFGATDRSYVDRAEMLQGHVEPENWLDVGAGHGHFCLVARDTWPDTAFDGLDLSDSIEEAERRGWVDQGHRGQFVDAAASLSDRYDVVSMHHYLEHTREPLEELDAASTALRPGGHLLIELPDPESPFG